MEIGILEGREPDTWVVETIDTESEGEIRWASFIGLDAQELAKDYADWLTAKQEVRRLLYQCRLTAH